MASKQRISLRDVDIAINGKIVGGVEEVACTVTRELTPAGEGGTFETVEIVEGFETVEGTVTRAFLDTDLINELYPNIAVLPAFTLSGSINNGKTPDRTIQILGVKFGGFELSDMAKDSEYIKTSMPFKATKVKLI